MRVYAVFLVVVCCFLCPLCAGDYPKPDDASSSSIGMINRCDTGNWVKAGSIFSLNR